MFRLRKNTLQQIFLNAISAMKRSNNATKIIASPVPKEIPGAFIAHQTNDRRIHLYHWTGKSNEDLVNNPAFLGLGSNGVVQKTVHLSTGEVSALKTIRSDLPLVKRQSQKRSLLTEYDWMQKLSQDPQAIGFVKAPRVLILDGDMTGMIGHLYAGDLFKFAEFADRYQASVGDVMNGLLTVLKAMQYLKNHSIAHRDIKLGNVLFEVVNGKLSCVLSDFGGMRTCAEIAARHFVSDTRFSDIFYQAQLKQSKAPYAKYKDFIEKLDIYSFGLLMINLFTLEEQPNPPSLSHYENRISDIYGADIDTILKGIFSAKPDGRPSVEAVIAAFEAFLNDQTPEGISRRQQAFNKKLQDNVACSTQPRALKVHSDDALPSKQGILKTRSLE